MPTVTLHGCSPVTYGYIQSHCPDGVSVVSPRPVERRDTIVNLIPITIHIDASAVAILGGAALAALLAKMAAFAKANPNIDVDGESVPVVDQPKVAKSIERGADQRIEHNKQASVKNDRTG